MSPGYKGEFSFTFRLSNVYVCTVWGERGRDGRRKWRINISRKRVKKSPFVAVTYCAVTLLVPTRGATPYHNIRVSFRGKYILQYKGRVFTL